MMMLSVLLSMNIYITTSSSRGITDEDVDIITAKVIEVIDGEAIKVMVSEPSIPKVMLVKMIGIDTESSMEAIDYTYSNLMGKTVMLTGDHNSHLFETVNGWDHMYVYRTPVKSFNEELVEKGLAKVDESYLGAEQYFELIECQSKAKKNFLGLWKEYEESKNQKVININTATIQEIIDTLEDTSSIIASAIVNYRRYNPYNSIEEVKFAHENITAEWFEKHKYNMSVITDINSANLFELSSLFATYKDHTIANSIIEYRIFNPINNIEDIYKINGITETYKSIEDFITVIPAKIYIDKNVKVANINTASVSQIVEATNLSTYRANKITEARDDGKYIIKTLGELEKGNQGLSSYDSKRFLDNMSLYTNMNTALEFELESLFGKVNVTDARRDKLIDYIINLRPYNNKSDLIRILGIYYNYLSPYIYTNETEIPEYLNINLCNKNYAMIMLGLDSTSADTYLITEEYYKDSSDINFNYEPYTNKFSLFTNINKASVEELKHMHDQMPLALVEDIIEFRAKQPFNSLEEVEKLFKEDYEAIYKDIKDFIVLY